METINCYACDLVILKDTARWINGRPFCGACHEDDPEKAGRVRLVQLAARRVWRLDTSFWHAVQNLLDELYRLNLTLTIHVVPISDRTIFVQDVVLTIQQKGECPSGV